MRCDIFYYKRSIGSCCWNSEEQDVRGQLQIIGKPNQSRLTSKASELYSGDISISLKYLSRKVTSQVRLKMCDMFWGSNICSLPIIPCHICIFSNYRDNYVLIEHVLPVQSWGKVSIIAQACKLFQMSWCTLQYVPTE